MNVLIGIALVSLSAAFFVWVWSIQEPRYKKMYKDLAKIMLQLLIGMAIVGIMMGVFAAGIYLILEGLG